MTARRPLSTCDYGRSVVPEPLIGTGELALALGLSAKTIQRYRRAGLITPAIVTRDKHARWRLSDVQAQLVQLPPAEDQAE